MFIYTVEGTMFNTTTENGFGSFIYLDMQHGMNQDNW